MWDAPMVVNMVIYVEGGVGELNCVTANAENMWEAY